jgi:hypothetical protein
MVLEAALLDSSPDCMADGTHTQDWEHKQIAGDMALVVVIEIGSWQSVEDCKLPVGVVVTGHRPWEADTDADILTMPETYSRYSQMNFYSVTENSLKDCSKTAPLAALQQSSQTLVDHSDICCCSDRRKPHHRHYQNLTASAAQDSDYWDLALLVEGIEREARLRIVVGHLTGKTSWSFWKSARNRFNATTSNRLDGGCRDWGASVQACNLWLVASCRGWKQTLFPHWAAQGARVFYKDNSYPIR